ncbi:ROK family protein [Planosporangium flavigriseum]|uniref:Polyphosphate glucokinase n=1 Tax=Planosporangium flavigriseum TaxID=373681 RepID=A0A8J3PMZ3_9ACTN|nr:ROK family protein [Planosporangium flavigriseum]NJC66883.1 ROK family protein [Planosporangium flavigriseum]GIG74373.1 polyphosphate glucokinase [Planosporangium flavigriseum]
MTTLGIDIGGSGIKGAPVDLDAGDLADKRYRVETPQPATVDRVVETVAEVARQFADVDTVGITFPGVVVGGVTRTAANVDKAWIDAPAAELFARAIGRPVTVLNDADAAGIAEMTYGAGRNQHGTTVMLTFGTGIGSALFRDGQLVPNTEFGHLELDGVDAEVRASDRARDIDDLSWPQWAQRVQRYLRHVEQLLQPDLMIIGGGVSKKAEKFLPLIEVRTPLVPAVLQNNAGIIGAALAADQGTKVRA